jgi:hypothetical protein
VSVRLLSACLLKRLKAPNEVSIQDTALPDGRGGACVRGAITKQYLQPEYGEEGIVMAKQNENSIILYQDDNGITKVSVRFSDEDLWLTQKQIAQVYDTTQQNISQHIDGIYRDNELSQEATHKDFLLVQTEGSRQVKREVSHYNLDMIIALGYRVQSQIATRFRRWATERLHEYIQKGFTMDDGRLKQGGSCYFRELLPRPRDETIGKRL